MGYLGLLSLVFFPGLLLHFNLCNALPLLSPYHNNSLSVNTSVSYANRDILLSSLSNTPNNTRFFSKSAGNSPIPTHLLFQCRADVNDNLCKNCKDSAVQYFKEDKTPNVMLYDLFYDECWLYYSGYYKTPPTFKAYYAPQSSSEPTERFANLLEGLVPDASSSPNLYAKFTNLDGVYGFVQCVPNISRSDCKECLTETIAYLPTCCKDHSSATVLYPSCFIRYATEDFFDNGKSAYPPALPPQNGPPPTSGKSAYPPALPPQNDPPLTSEEHNSSSEAVVTWNVSIILGVILISMGTLWG